MCGSSSGKIWRIISNPHPPFRYSPLSSRQIRILTLFPGQPGSPLEISLKEICLSAVEYDYEALSYVWGNPTRQVSIKCNQAELKITTSVQLALCRLRYQNKPRKLWVDAICINQEDYDERAHQVPLMKEIYPRADKVLVWLGEADKKDELALKAIDEWATFNRQYRRDSDATRFSKFEERFAFKPGYRDTLEAVGRLTYRSWFNRCWTFQEILLSSRAELLVGEFRITWDCFYHALEAFPLHLLAENVLNFNALFMCHGKAKVKDTAFTNSDSYPVSRNLSRILQITRNFTATDPRDKIFSILSISVMKNPCIFRPNYSKSIRETFVSLTLAMIQDENSLNVIMSCGEKNRDKALPSWCPDWSCERGVTLTGYYDYISYDVNAGLKPDLRNLQMNELFELEFDGALIDVVNRTYDLEALGDELRASAKDASFIDVLSKFVRKTGLQDCLLHDRLSPEAVLLRTLSADHWFFGAHLQGSYKEYWFPTHLRFRDLKRNMIKMRMPSMETYRSTITSKPGLEVSSMVSGSIQQNEGSNFNLDTGPEPEHLDYEVESPFTHAVIDKVYRQASPFYVEGQDFDDAKNIDTLTLSAIAKEAISQALFFFKGKKILISERGFVAIGQENTKVGDSFCSFLGADVPFIIRKKKRSVIKETRSNCRGKNYDTVPDLYEIIGECYMDGIMYGELFHIMNEIKGNRNQNPRKPNKNCLHQKLEPMVDWVQIKKFRIS
ncbi:putative heterokaryon incompatibility protein [Golovinomyces cichoracearum]|uniref:Putative heterokaryon incompatibility protein n=1 Tax=Golovinomyces cichoracearum TaxID=62708 RepID=A0A420H895_9PEZI|nr:putative heterokaryon incompatibility protein [Golovinomyces cichoracearum]